MVGSLLPATNLVETYVVSPLWAVDGVAYVAHVLPQAKRCRSWPLMGILIDGAANAAVGTEALKLHTADKDLP